MQDIQALDRKGLREFGLTTGAIIAALFGFALPWLFRHDYPVWPWMLGVLLIACAAVAPDALRPVHKNWMRLALLLNRFTTPLIMAAVFYFIITPVAFGFRLRKRDPMARRFDENARSYRIISRKYTRGNMERPY